MDADELREIPLHEQTVYHGGLFDVTRREVRLPNGSTAGREIVRHAAPAASVVPVDAEGYVYLVRQYRAGCDILTLEIPAGKQDSAEEDNLVCAVRELSEETGLVAERMELMMTLVSTPAFCNERIGLYLATGLSQHGAHLDRDEFLNVERVPLAEAVGRVMSGEICDAKTALGLLMAARRLGL